ncbi:MAG: hypothetical protein MZV70_61575 [Desulfobacterales bacterium]|nr:hypothetical protein [Desulfobacterales bacterium]
MGDMTGSVSYSGDHLRHEILVGGISNAVFNGLIARLMLKGGPDLQWGGKHSFATDVIATGLLLPLIVALIVILRSAENLLTGASCKPLTWGPSSSIQSTANRMPASTWKSAPLFGLFGMCV